MSSSFWIERDRPSDAAAIIGGLDRPGVEVTGGPWPERSLLVWLPGASSRGVEVSHEDNTLQVRILAMSSPEDYDLAFRLVEVLGAGREVSIEGGEPAPAEEVRSRCQGAWMVRDLAAAVASLRVATQTHTVTISGPVRGLEIARGAAIDSAKVIDVLRFAQVMARRGVEDDREEEEGEKAAPLAIVIDVDRVRAFTNVAVDAGPDSLDGVAEPPEVRVRDLDHGFLVDRERRRLLVVGEERTLPAWAGFEISWHDDSEALLAYLGERELALPARGPDPDDPPWDRLAAELTIGEDEHDAWLAALERAAAPAPPKPPASLATKLLVLPLFFLVAIVALPVRILAIPFRRRVRRWHKARERRRTDQFRVRILEKTARLADVPDDVDARNDRALHLMMLREWSAADRELGRCLRDLAAGASAKVTAGGIFTNRSIARERLGHRALAAQDRTRAVELGYRITYVRWWRRAPRGVADVFLMVAGLGP
jgi:hypothetical protein